MDGILVEALKDSDHSLVEVQKDLVAQYCCQSYKARLGLCNWLQHVLTWKRQSTQQK